MVKFSRRTWIMIIAALAVLGAGVIYSCGSSKSSNPNYGGGGGGGGLELNSGTIAPGADFVHTFTTAGTFPYHCTIHSSMTGNQIIVSASAPLVNDNLKIIGPGGGLSGTGYDTASVTIKVGGTVTWHNSGGLGHTVTSGS